MSIKHKLRKIFWRVGYDITRFSSTTHPIARKKQLLGSQNIDTILDIGANIGQFAHELRYDLNFTKRIISFEPLDSAFELLRENAKGDPDWEVFNFALGDTEKKQEIHIAGNSYSSSLLEMLPSHLKSAPESKTIGRQIIEVKRLDSIFTNLCKPNNRIYMKIDTQGYENKVLQGAENSIRQIDTVELEMSLVPLYEGEWLFNEMYLYMIEKGYHLFSVETEFTDPDSGQLLQVNGIFTRL